MCEVVPMETWIRLRSMTGWWLQVLFRVDVLHPVSLKLVYWGGGSCLISSVRSPSLSSSHLYRTPVISKATMQISLLISFDSPIHKYLIVTCGFWTEKPISLPCPVLFFHPFFQRQLFLITLILVLWYICGLYPATSQSNFCFLFFSYLCLKY